MPPNCKSIRALHRSPNAAATNMGCTGAGNAQPSFVRHSLSGAQTINKSFWADTLHSQQHAKGYPHQAAPRALAFKWIRFLYHCRATRTLYNEAKHLRALERPELQLQ